MIEIDKLLSTDNSIFSGGFGLALLAIGAQGLRLGSNILINLIRKHLIISLEITNKDKSYPWILQWITLQGTKTQHLSVETLLKNTNNHNTNTIFNLVPGPGNHFIFYHNHILGIQRIREQQMLDLNTGKPWEKIQIYGFGRNTKIFDDLLQEALEIATRKEDGKTIIFTNWGTEWRPFGQPRPRRSLESVILDEGIGEKIYADILEWKNSFQWYSDRGIPYRRGYLLYGPPGSGKTSFIMALAGCLGYNICVLNLSERGLTDDRLAVALSAVPPMCIVLLEDVDVAFPHPNRSSNKSNDNKHHGITGSIASYGGGSSEVTFSGLLNILDGAVSSEERLIFMTTNYVDRLDSALIRPGRIDLAQLISDATPYQIRKLFTTFYPGVSEELTEEFLNVATKINRLSMAQLQGYFLIHKDNPQAVLEYVKQISNSNLSLPNSSPTTNPENISNDNSINESQPINVQKVQRNQGVRRITSLELDKMPFNPQYDWEKDIRK